MTSDRTILITGVTGNQGGAVAKALQGSGFHLRGLTRMPEGVRAAALARQRVDVVKGDLDDEATLRRALAGAWGVFGVQNAGEAGVEREEAQGQASCDAGARGRRRTLCLHICGIGAQEDGTSSRNWEPVGRGIDHLMVTAVDVGHAEQADGFGVVYAGTEPSAVFGSDNGGDSWVDLAGLRALPSADTWSFPPRPQTHHVRWIEADVSVADRVFVAIEAGALVRTFDGGRIWRDRVRGGPYDTQLATQAIAMPKSIVAADDAWRGWQ